MAIKMNGLSSWHDEPTDYEDDNERLYSAEGREISHHKNSLQKILDLVKKDGLKLLCLVVFNGLYLYLGGIVFYLLERQPKKQLDVKRYTKMIFNTLTNSSFAMATRRGNLIDSLGKSEVNQLKHIFKMAQLDLNSEDATPWTLTNSVFFASTVVTTIGYGNLAPATLGGRLFCVCYAMVGIPLTLMLLAMVGKILSKYINNFCSYIINYLKKYLYPDYEFDSTNGSTDLNAPVWLAASFITIFISLDALIIMSLEGWDFAISLYFIFITLTTIGFGDIVPHNTAVVWFNVTLMYIGLAAVSITINLLIANITIQYQKHRHKHKFIKTLSTKFDSDEDQDDEKTPLTK